MGKDSGVASTPQERRPQGEAGVAATPLTWIASKPSASNGFAYVDSVSDPDDDVLYGNIATVWGNEGDALATARLFAAAPELLRVLKFAREILLEADARLGYAPDSLGQLEMDEALADSEVAIAKAEGRSC
jgi:hypothetical protein